MKARRLRLSRSTRLCRRRSRPAFRFSASVGSRWGASAGKASNASLPAPSATCQRPWQRPPHLHLHDDRGDVADSQRVTCSCDCALISVPFPLRPRWVRHARGDLLSRARLPVEPHLEDVTQGRVGRLDDLVMGFEILRPDVRHGALDESRLCCKNSLSGITPSSRSLNLFHLVSS